MISDSKFMNAKMRIISLLQEQMQRKKEKVKEYRTENLWEIPSEETMEKFLESIYIELFREIEKMEEE